MKRITALLLVTCMFAGLFVACGEDAVPGIETGESTLESSASTETTGSVTTEASTAETQDTTSGTESTTEASTQSTTTPETTEATQETTEQTKATEETKPAETTKPTSEPTKPATEPTSEPTSEPTKPTTPGGNIGEDLEFILDCNEITLNEAGQTYTIYTGEISISDITWTTDNAKIATIKNGVVTAVGDGTTKVYGKYGTKKLSCKVICEFAEETVPPTTVPADPSAPVMAPPSYSTVDSSFFDDALFIGDSVSQGLNNYVSAYGGLGNAKFATRASYGVANEITGNLRVTLFGTPTRIEEIVRYYNPGKIFIMLGMNELSYGSSTLMSYWGTYLSRVREAAPNAVIYIQSVTPVYTNGQNFSWGVTNKNVETLNGLLRTFAANNGCRFLDVAPYMKDSTGGLARAYTADRYVHLSNDGARAWIKVLYALAG